MFQIEFAYSSVQPPNFETVKKLIEWALNPICGKVSVKELPHHALTIGTWVMPVSISVLKTPPVSEIEDALKTFKDAFGARLLEVKMDHSESSGIRPVSPGDSALGGKVSSQDNIFPPGDKGGGEK